MGGGKGRWWEYDSNSFHFLPISCSFGDAITGDEIKLRRVNSPHLMFLDYSSFSSSLCICRRGHAPSVHQAFNPILDVKALILGVERGIKEARDTKKEIVLAVRQCSATT